MRLRRRRTKKDQALDLVATAAKAWSEWQLAKKATKGVKKGATTAARAAVITRVAPVKAITGAVLATGAGALVVKKLKGRGAAAPTPSPPAEPPAPVAPVATPGATPGAAPVPAPDLDAPVESAPHQPAGEGAAKS